MQPLHAKASLISISNSNSSKVNSPIKLKTKDVANRVTKKRPPSPHKGNPKKKGRIITKYEQNLAPSVKYVEDLKLGIMEHAHLRLQLFYITCGALYKKAVQSDGSILDVHVTIASAHKQDGQGDRAEHAAHANAAAGYCDDLMECYIEVIHLNGLTPIKTRVLKDIKNFPEEIIAELASNHKDAEFVESTIKLYWEKGSVLRGARIEHVLNATNKLPAALNLGCNRSLEGELRPLIAELYRLVLRGEMDPDKALEAYHRSIHLHFEDEIKSLEEKLEQITDRLKIEKIQKQLFYNKTEKEGSSIKGIQYLRKDFQADVDKGVPAFDLEKSFDLFIS